jgi:hypothetical protein
MVGKHIDIVFDGPPSAESGRFVEVEDNTGARHGHGGMGSTRRWLLGASHIQCRTVQVEQDRGDGRKAHYGSGRQPLDDIVEAGWGPAFCAGNVLKYLRRDKDVEDSRKKAKWYFDFLIMRGNDTTDPYSPEWMLAGRQLTRRLLRVEMDVLGLPSCFKPRAD